MTIPEAVLAAARAARRVVVLTGAGMSDESGVPTFRDAHTGLWEQFDADALVTNEAWQEDPDLVWGWHWWLARLVRRSVPHEGHAALAQWARRTRVDVITQNVDDLHERAGSLVLAHLHGNLFTFSCQECALAYELEVDPLGPQEVLPERIDPPVCPACGGLAVSYTHLDVYKRQGQRVARVVGVAWRAGVVGARVVVLRPAIACEIT